MEMLYQLLTLIGICAVILTATATLDSIQGLQRRTGRRYWGDNQTRASKPDRSSTP